MDMQSACGDKAIISCEDASYNPKDHFADISKMVDQTIGSYTFGTLLKIFHIFSIYRLFSVSLYV